ncbi:MAG TPA: hypothetical protein VFJ76_01675 [Solirubrobacterales bacterium]|nr:hypothetical protein [Solirubrobacterales bacterium]
MKHLKMLGLAVVAAAALMAFVGAGTASATKLCKDSACAEDYPAETEIKSSLSGSAILETIGGVTLDTCSGGEVNGKTPATEGEPLSGNISALTWEGCTRTTDTTVNGSLAIKRVLVENENKELVPNGNGTVTGSGSSVTVNGIFGTSCVYGTGTNTPLGTLVGGNPATITINALVPRTVANALCPAETRWTASYTVTSPKPLFIG